MGEPNLMMGTAHRRGADRVAGQSVGTPKPLPRLAGASPASMEATLRSTEATAQVPT